MISRRDALELVKYNSKYAHLLIASKLMKRLAIKLDENSLEWELTGLLHDLDFDEVKDDMNKHGVVACESLKDKLPEHCLYAIKAHDYRSGYEPQSKLDKALVLVDSLAILVQSIEEKSMELTIKALRDELNKVDLKEPWHRGNIEKCVEIGLNQNELLNLAVFH